MESRSVHSGITKKSRKRSRQGTSEGRALISAWKASGLSQAAFSRRAGIPKQRIAYWRRRLPSPGSTPTPGFVEIPSPSVPVRTGLGFMVEVSDPVRVRVEHGFDPALLRSVVRALAGEASC